MKNRLATVYAFAFHTPRALHPLILENWSHCSFAKFVLLTERAEQWRSIAPHAQDNIEIVQIDIESLFQLAFPLLGVQTFAELKSERGWLFTPHEFQMGGYLGCQLRPAMSTLLPRHRTPYWGWIDNDVLINSTSMQKYLESDPGDVLLCPKVGFAWEQFKLYSTKINTTMIYKEFIDHHISNRVSPPGPMEARFVYHVRDTQPYKMDDPGQARLAIHWGYADLIAKERGLLPNQYPVHISSESAFLTGPDDQDILFFNADTQVKTFNEDDARRVRSHQQSGGGYTFDYVPAA